MKAFLDLALLLPIVVMAGGEDPVSSSESKIPELGALLRGRSHRRSRRTGAPPKCIASGAAGPCHPGAKLAVNPFKTLPILQKVHHAWTGNMIERTVPGKPPVADGAFEDYVRITGSAPFDVGDSLFYGAMAADRGVSMRGVFVEAVRACVAAKRSSGREGVIGLNQPRAVKPF